MRKPIYALLFALSFLCFRFPLSGQTFEVKDRNGILVVTISDVKMFRFSSHFKTDIPDLQGIVKNVSGVDLTLDLSLDELKGTVYTKAGTVEEFFFSLCQGDPNSSCTFFPKNSVHEIS